MSRCATSRRPARRLCCAAALLCLTTPLAAGDAPAGGRSLEQRIASLESGLRPAVVKIGEMPETWMLSERMAHYGVPAVSLAVIEDGEIVVARAYGYADVAAREPATAETAFSVGSVSKMGTAAGVLRLAAEDRVDLDRDVNRYLESWLVPENAHTRTAPVTIRGILSHSAGLSVHGFPDFLPGEALPTLVETLDGRPPAKHGAVRAVYAPGSSAAYSGGGTTVLQLLVEDRTGSPFAEAMRELVFEPLGMTRSSYVNPIPESHAPLAKAYDGEGEPAALPRGWHSFPEAAASGLWTTPTDIAKLYIALADSYHGVGDRFLPREIARDMMTEVGPSYFGLGPELAGEGLGRRFYHGGSNESYKAHSEMHLERRSGLVIFTNGARGQALYREIRRAVADAFDWPYYHPIRVPERAGGPALRASLDAHQGDYRVAEPLDPATRRMFVVRPLLLLRLIRAGDGLQVTFPGFDDRRYELAPVTPARFVVRDYYGAALEPLRIELVSTGSASTEAVILYAHGHSATAARIESAGDTGPAPDRH